MMAYLYTIIVDGCGSEDGALAENGSYMCVCVWESRWGKGGRHI